VSSKIIFATKIVMSLQLVIWSPKGTYSPHLKTHPMLVEVKLIEQ